MLSKPAIERLCMIYSFLERIDETGQEVISSSKLEELTGIKAHTIRKDLSYIENIKSSGNGYIVSDLKGIISKTLGLGIKRKACVVGLGNLGTAILNYPGFFDVEYEIAAGFDSSINRIELMDTKVPLYPAYEIEEWVRAFNIELGVIAVPGKAAQKTAERLRDGGIKGIVNFAPVNLKNMGDIIIKNIYVVQEFRILSSLIRLNKK